MLHVRIDPLDYMENLGWFFVDPRIDKPWRSTLREKLPRSVRLRYINWGAKERQHCQSLWNAESMNNMLSNKLNYLLMCHILQRNRFGPFSKVIRSNQHEAGTN